MADDHGHIHLDQRRLFWALLLTGVFMVAETIGGMLTHSLALIADATHMISDFVSLLLSFGAYRIANKPSDLMRSYGYHRFQVLAAFVNGLTLIGLSVWICVEAFNRLVNVPPIEANMMLVIAVLGLLVNIICYMMLHSSHEHNINTESAKFHVLGDLLGSVAAISAALLILYFGWREADPVLSIAVSLIVFFGGYKFVKKSGNVLLEGTPEEVDPLEVKAILKNDIQEVLDIHHIHIWSLTGSHPILTLHAKVSAHHDYSKTLKHIHQVLAEKCHIHHATIQIEYDSCPDEGHDH